GYKVIRFPYYKRHLYEGWRIRKLIKKGKKWEDRVPRYLIFNFQFSIFNLIKKVKEKKKIFKNIVVGGTFDHFHKGHRALLKSALRYGRRIIIGITSDNFVKNKNLSETIECFNIRKNNVSNFLKKQKDFYKASIIKINDFVGDLDKRKNIETIVVSKNTYLNALKINDIREKNNLKKMRIIICSDVFSEDGKIISSERIRKGEIDRDGKNYWFFLESFLKKEKKELVLLPENLKKELRKPLGKILKNIDEAIKFIKNKKPLMIVSVGDIITKSFLEKKINPNLKIIDFKSRRKFIEKKEYINIFEKKILLKNNPGTINLKTAEKIKIFFENFSCQKPFFIIDGEEDLLALPAILFAPLNCLVFYGHFQYGIIGVVVNERIKKHVVEILIKFN
ncbi:MAG: pantetheine-phosphate adenylyltransferase, partial [Patescibacteria group bacterium]|nr:pantetheine-phosphate adenylyltransferase [Patescibacteria group bacterium]